MSSSCPLPCLETRRGRRRVQSRCRFGRGEPSPSADVGRGVHASIWPANGVYFRWRQATTPFLQCNGARDGRVACHVAPRPVRLVAPPRPATRRATAAAVSVAVYRQRQREALSAAHPRDPPRAPAGLGRARACKSAAHRTTTEHAARRFVGLFPFPLARFSLALVFFTFPRVCVFVLLVVPPRMTHHTPVWKGNRFCGTRSRRRLRVSFVYSFGLSAPNYQWRCLDIECEVRDLA